MSFVISHPSVAPFVQHAARALHEAHLLLRFYTTLTNNEHSILQRAACAAARLTGRNLRSQLRRRTITEIPESLVTSLPLTEIIRLASAPLDRSGRLTDLFWSWSEPSFDRRVARCLPAETKGVYGFEYSSLATFRMARKRGLATIYDVPSPEPAYVRGVIDREVDRFPVLDTPYHRHTREREERRLTRRRAERDLADLVVAASQLTRDTYVAAGLPAARVCVVPYGAPPPAPLDEANSGGSRGAGKLRFLWAGTFNVRKGAHYLLAAWRQGQLGRHAVLRVHGVVTLPDTLLNPLPEGVELGGSIPREQLMSAYHKADALVFPTLCDGFGMVATEAWSRGLPIITTMEAGVADFLREKENGLLVAAANTVSLTAALTWCLDNRRVLQAMREPALSTASRWQWSDYRCALIDAVRPLLQAQAHPTR